MKKPAVFVVIALGFILTIAIVVIVIVLRSSVKQKATPLSLETLKSANQMLRTQTTEGTDGLGNAREVKQIYGVVTNWNYKAQRLTVRDDQGTNEYSILVPQTVVMVPSFPRDKNRMILRTVDDAGWKTAFCENDSVTVAVGTDYGDVVFVYSGGPRLCAESTE